jgi:hypothetical protein
MSRTLSDTQATDKVPNQPESYFSDNRLWLSMNGYTLVGHIKTKKPKPEGSGIRDPAGQQALPGFRNNN